MNSDDFERRLQRQPLRQIPHEWRADILRAAESAGAQPAIPGSAFSWLFKPWRELIWAARRVWLGFAFIWLVIVAINLADTEKPGKAETAMKIPPENIVTAWERQQRLLTELNNPEPATDSDRPKSSPPKPRSERRALQANV